MHPVPGVSAISSGSRVATAFVVSRANPTPRTPAAATVTRAPIASPAASNPASSAAAAPAATTDLPMGLLLSVNPPAAGNSLATADYQAMRQALLVDSTAAAQRAYLRLQSDLLMGSSAAAGNVPTASGRLNAAA
jgi:hypothetical protein